MRTLFILLLWLAGCATPEQPRQLTADEIARAIVPPQEKTP